MDTDSIQSSIVNSKEPQAVGNVSSFTRLEPRATIRRFHRFSQIQKKPRCAASKLRPPVTDHRLLGLSHSKWHPSTQARMYRSLWDLMASRDCGASSSPSASSSRSLSTQAVIVLRTSHFLSRSGQSFRSDVTRPQTVSCPLPIAAISVHSRPTAGVDGIAVFPQRLYRQSRATRI